MCCLIYIDLRLFIGYNSIKLCVGGFVESIERDWNVVDGKFFNF